MSMKPDVQRADRARLLLRMGCGETLDLCHLQWLRAQRPRPPAAAGGKAPRKPGGRR